jgi:hypothetical protein
VIGVTARAYRRTVRSDEIDQVPPAVVERLRGICSALPEVHELEDAWSHGFLVRKANVVSASCAGGTTFCSVRAEPEEIDALLAAGHPFFATGQGNRIGIVLDDATNWSELDELVRESYRLLAPKKLVALLEDAT